MTEGNVMRNYYRKYLALAIIGSIIIGLAFYLLLNSYLDKKAIVVASKNIEEGQKVSEGDLDFKEYYKGSLPENYMTDKKDAIGKTINIERKKDDYISNDMFDEKNNKSFFDDMKEGDVVIAIDVKYQEPLLEEVEVGSYISIVSTVSEKDLLYSDYLGLKENAENKYLDQTDSYYKSSSNSGSRYFIASGDYIDKTMFNLSENIVLINSQVMVRNLEVICIEKNVPSSNKAVLLSNNDDTINVYLKCSVKEAPIIARLTKDDDYKIVIEKI